MKGNIQEERNGTASKFLAMKGRVVSRPDKLMNSLYSLLALIAVVSSYAGNLEVVSKPSAGETNLAIVKDKNDGTDYFFVDTKTNERLRDVLGHLRSARINDIKASWSPDGRKVAVFISYGTRLNTIFLYSLGDDRKMKSVELPDIDPIAFYDKRDPNKHFLRQAEGAVGYSENALGGWMTNDTVKIIRGDAVVQPDDAPRTKHFLIELEIKVAGEHAKIVKLSATGVLSDEQAEKFIKNWKH